MLARNVALNLIGMGAPILLALLCIPQLIEGLGLAAFGLLSLVWVVLGYFSVFDLGIGRALTLALSQRLSQNDISRIGQLAYTGTVLATCLGALGGGVLALGAARLAVAMTRDDPLLTSAAEASLYAIAVALPAVTATAALRGVLEAHGRFGVTNSIRLAMGFITYGGPLLVIQRWDGLVPVVLFLTLARGLTCLVHWIAVRHALPEPVVSPRRWSPAEARPLLTQGGWMTCSNVISPLMTYMDRFVVAYVVGSGTVAYYTTPYEAISRLTIVAEAVLVALFPALGAAMASQPDRARALYAQGVRVMLAVMLPIATVLVACAHALLSLWISPEFADRSYLVLQVLTLGICVNCIARVTFAAIQSQGRADLTAKLHLVEFPFFLTLLIALCYSFGTVGAAAAWTVRALIDFTLLIMTQRRLMLAPLGLGANATMAGLLLVASALALGIPNWAPIGQWATPALVVVTLAVSGFWVLTADDRRLLRDLVSRLVRR